MFQRVGVFVEHKSGVTNCAFYTERMTRDLHKTSSSVESNVFGNDPTDIRTSVLPTSHIMSLPTGPRQWTVPSRHWGPVHGGSCFV